MEIGGLTCIETSSNIFIYSLKAVLTLIFSSVLRILEGITWVLLWEFCEVTSPPEKHRSVGGVVGDKNLSLKENGPLAIPEKASTFTEAAKGASLVGLITSETLDVFGLFYVFCMLREGRVLRGWIL